MFGTEPEPVVGRFIPTRQLIEWHNQMKQRYPQVYPADDKLFGDCGKQHTLGTKLKTFFDGDVTKPMNCEVVGSCWNSDFTGKEPHYLILMEGDDEISQIPLTSAHEEGGWEVLESGMESSDDDDDGEDDIDDFYEGHDVAVPTEERPPPPPPISRENKCSNPNCAKCDATKICSRCRDVNYCNAKCQKAHWKIHKFACIEHGKVRHQIEESASLETIQKAITDANVNDVIILPAGSFGSLETESSLEIKKNLHFTGQGMDETILKCQLIIRQDGCSGGKAIFRNFKVQGTVEVIDNTFDDLSFISVEVRAERSRSDAFRISNCPGKVLLYCCEIIGGAPDGLCLLDHSTNVTIDQTDISYAQSRGIFSNINFKIKDSSVYNCGGYGIKGRMGWTDLGGNDLQPGPWSEYGPY